MTPPMLLDVGICSIWIILLNKNKAKQTAFNIVYSIFIIYHVPVCSHGSIGAMQY
jgi:hypothetical protein